MNSGDVVAAHAGGARRRQYDIVGDVASLGSRLCGQAAKGGDRPDGGDAGLLSNPPAHESMGAVQLKGLNEPVPLVRVVMAKAAVESGAAAS